MITIRAKSKKAAPDICSEISNKISTRRALSVVEATRQNVLEVFFLFSNHDKLPLVVTETTSLFLAGFLPVKVLSKKHTWVSFSVVFFSTKSSKVFNNRSVNKLTKSSKKWGQLLVSAIITLNLFVVPNEILDEIFVASSSILSKMGQDQLLVVLPNVVFSSRSSLVLEAKQSPPVGSPVLENWADQMETELLSSLVSGVAAGAYVKAAFQSIHGFLSAKSISKDNIKLFCIEFAFQSSLNAVFLVELTNSVCLVTFKIAKFLVVFESGSSPAVVALCDVPLGVSTADIKSAHGVFGEVSCVLLKPAGVWQYVVVYFKELDAAAFALTHWSILRPKTSGNNILLFTNQNETILFHDQFKAKLVNLLSGCTAFEISDMISQIGGQTCFISYLPDSGHYSWFALVMFENAIFGEKLLVVDTALSALKVFKTHFVNGVSYAKASAFLDFSEFPSLTASAFSSMVLSVLVESIVKPVGFLVKLFEQFINGNLVSNSKLGLKVNEVIVHLGFFSKIVGKLEIEVVFLKKKCCIENIDMFGNSECPIGLDDEVFSNLMFFWEHKSINVKTNVLKTAK
ncbi:hypothetical protein G9A89_011982 [Geosiphon pyriformis]|nr:hypothetical protein G9A89_011982 [Geosiphon pyriformis]